MNLTSKLEELRRYSLEDLDAAVEKTLLRKTEDPIALEARAILVTALRETGLWPKLERARRKRRP